MKTGDVVAGRFELVAVAGRGGMGEVWRARDGASGPLVALKFLLDPSGGFARFSREAELLAAVTHPALVAHVAHGDDGGLPWLAMEWLEGPTLADRLEAAPLETGEAVEVARRIAGALDALHETGVVHRDVKPSNVMLSRGLPDHAVLLDLGVARPLFATSALTADNLAIGTLGYMAPEQARGQRDLDARADVFALGAVLYECLAGAPAFGGEHALAILSALLCEDPPPLAAVRPDLPADLGELVDAMLSKERRARPRAREVERALSSLHVGAPGARPGPRRRPERALSAAEQRLSLVAAVTLGVSAGEQTFAASEHAEIVEQLARVARAHGAELAELPGGALLVVTDARGTAADRAGVLADALLAIRHTAPLVRCGLAAGLSAAGARDPSADILSRALRLAARAEGVRADAVAGDLLPGRFVRAARDDGVELTASSSEPPARRALFVGRDKELALLEATLAEASEESAVRSVLVLAPPGAGKSGLGQELARRLRRRGDVTLLEARAEVAHAGAVHALLRDLVRGAAGLDAAPKPSDRSAILAYVRGLGDGQEAPERVGDFLAWLAGVTDLDGAGPELSSSAGDRDLMSRWLRRVVRAWLSAAASAAPLVLLLEDLHWSDPSSLALLDDALRAQRSRAILVVGLARPEAEAELPLAFPALTKLPLAGLGARSAERLVRGLLGADARAESVAKIVERAQGSPLFLAELSRFVQEGRGDDLPSTVVAVLEARLAEVDAATRRTLRAASVIGKSVTANAVAAVSGEPAAEVARVLRGLAGRSLIEEEPDAEGTFHFAHALVREVAYASLPPEDRRLTHARAAAFLEADGQPEPRTIARHWELAEEPKRAVTWLVEATNQAIERGAEREGFALAARGVALGAQGEELGQLACSLAIQKLTFEVDLEEAARWTALALDNVPPDHPAWPLVAAGSVFHAASSGFGPGSEKKAELSARVVFTWLVAGVRVSRTRLAYLSALMVGLGLARLGRRLEGQKIRESCALPHARASAELAMFELAACPDAFYNAGAAGVVCSSAARASAHARVADDALVLGICDYFDARVRALVTTSHALAGELALVAERHRSGTYLSTHGGLEICVAIARARVEPSALGELRRRYDDQARRQIDRAIFELAYVGLVDALLRAGQLDEAEHAMREGPEPRAYTAAVRRIHLARLAAARGEPERALQELEAAEPLLREHAMVWQWEHHHAARVDALRALGRDDEARAALEAAEARLTVTLEGADEELRRYTREHVEPVASLRDAARALGAPAWGG